MRSRQIKDQQGALVFTTGLMAVGEADRYSALLPGEMALIEEVIAGWLPRRARKINPMSGRIVGVELH